MPGRSRQRAGRLAAGKDRIHRFFDGDRVFTIRPDGTGLVRVSQNSGRSRNPEFSPDGTMLAYDDDFRVFTVNPDGTGRRLLVRNGYDPTWSPSGDRILFSRYRVDNDVAIFSIQPTGIGPSELTDGSINEEPAWSPDGLKIVFVRDRDLPRLWTMNADGSEAKRLTPRSGTGDSTPEWSPDGRRVLFTRTKFYRPGCLYRGDLLVINADGGGMANLTSL
jgi:TolB protein